MLSEWVPPRNYISDPPIATPDRRAQYNVASYICIYVFVFFCNKERKIEGNKRD